MTAGPTIQDLHPAVQAWLCVNNGWPPVYAQLADMPCEDAMGLLYLLKEDVAIEESAEAVAVMQAKEQEIITRLMAPFRNG